MRRSAGEPSFPSLSWSLTVNKSLLLPSIGPFGSRLSFSCSNGFSGAGRCTLLIISDHWVTPGRGRSDDDARESVCSSDAGTGPSIGERLCISPSRRHRTRWIIFYVHCYNKQTCTFTLPEHWYSETGGLSYDEPKANTWHPLVWIRYERGSRHPLTAAVHKWSYKSQETLSLGSRQAYGSGCSCSPSPTSLSHVTTGLRTVWHLAERQPGRPWKCWVEQVTTSIGLSPSGAWSVATDRSAWKALRPVDGQAWAEREKERGGGREHYKSLQND